MRHEAAGITTENFPPQLRLGLNTFDLEYTFEPGSPRDGVTLTAPVALLNQVPAARCEWLVPGLLKEKVRLLAKSMPQRLRHKLGPLESFAEDFVATTPPSDLPLATALARHIRAELNLEVPLDAFRPDSVPPHLQMNFRVVDEHGRQLGTGRSLPDLKRALAAETQAVLQDEAPADEGEHYRAWTFGDLDEIMELRRGGQTLVGYPALADAGDGVTLQVFDAPERAAEVQRAGVRRLLAIAFRDRIREIEKSVARENALNLQFGQLGGDIELADEVVAAALERCFLADSLPLRQADFAQRVEDGRSRLNLIAQEIVRTVAAILAEQAQVQKRLGAVAKAFPQAAEDVAASVARLLHPRFISRTPWQRLQHFPRYLKAAVLRLEKLRTDPARDARSMAELAPLYAAWKREYAARAKAAALTPEIEQFGWLLEELRVSLFAQALKTPVPVSVKRLTKLWQSIRQAQH
jgi:ATP-dependent helicase HrpA